MMGSIYKISASCTDKVYIGQTIKEITERFNGHIITSNNGGDTHLYRAFKKYGIECFRVDLIENNIILKTQINESQNSLDLRERYWIGYYDCFRNGYNMTEGGNGTLGMKHSDETKKKISDKNTGKNRTLEMNLARSGDKASMSGKFHSVETKQKMRESAVGRNLTEETKEKIRVANIGKILSDETKKKISASNKGRIVSDETKEKRRITRRKNGPLVHSEESKKKQSESIKKARSGNLNYFTTYEIYNSDNELLYTVKDGLTKFLNENNLPIALMDTYRKDTKLYSSKSGWMRAKTLGYTEYIGWYIIKKDKK